MAIPTLPTDAEFEQMENEASYEELRELIACVATGIGDLSPAARQKLRIMLWHRGIRRETAARKMAAMRAASGEQLTSLAAE